MFQTQPRHPRAYDPGFGECSLKGSLAIASIELWDGRQVSEFLRGFEADAFDSHDRPPGYALLNRRIVSRGESSEVYPNPESCHPWQRQATGGRQSGEFDRALVARIGPCVAGILYCDWKKVPSESGPFWAYHLPFVDVHESWRGRGIASALIRDLDSQEWLRGKILQLSSYTRDGYEKLRHVISRSLRAEEYIVLHPEYASDTLPPSAGRWASSGVTF